MMVMSVADEFQNLYKTFASNSYTLRRVIKVTSLVGMYPQTRETAHFYIEGTMILLELSCTPLGFSQV